LRFDSADVTEIVGKTEGMALLGGGSLTLINDDDFGIAGVRTQIVLLKGNRHRATLTAPASQSRQSHLI
jgi:hypothetical protein